MFNKAKDADLCSVCSYCTWVKETLSMKLESSISLVLYSFFFPKKRLSTVLIVNMLHIFQKNDFENIVTSKTTKSHSTNSGIGIYSIIQNETCKRSNFFDFFSL
jgi:hypothetical protein